MIKKHKSRNQYYYAKNGLWTRDFTRPHVQTIDINNLYTVEDRKMILENELENRRKGYQNLFTEDWQYDNIVICSSGLDFYKKQILLAKLPADVTILGVNNILDQWMLPRKVHYYLVNNPYPECMGFIPQKWKIQPRCLASIRTYPEFLQKYSGLIYSYNPVLDKEYGIELESDLDDYRNVVCAAISLCWRLKAKKVLLFCCQESYTEEKPGTVARDDYWGYPAQWVAHDLIDAQLYWLKKAEIKVGWYGLGVQFNNAAYISEDKLCNFFEAN